MTPDLPEPGGAPRARVLTEVVLPSLLLMGAMFASTLIVAGLKELVVDELHGAARDAGLFFSIEMAAAVVGAPAWGLLSDRLGRRRPLVAAGFLASAPLYAAYGVVGSLPALFALRFLQGAASVLGWSTLMALVLDQPDEARRGRYMGLMGGALILGISLGAPIGGVLSLKLGPRAPLQAAGLLFLLLGLAALRLEEAPRQRPQLPVGRILAALRGRPRLLLPLLFHFAARYTVGLFVVTFPLYLASLGVTDPAQRGRFLGLFLLPFALLQYFTGRLSERIGPVRPLLLGTLGYGVVLCLLGGAGRDQLWLVMLALGVLAAVMFPPTLTLTALCSDASTRASAMGGFNLAGGLGFAIGPVAGAAAHEAWGYPAAFAQAGALEVAVALLALPFLRGLAPRSR